MSRREKNLKEIVDTHLGLFSSPSETEMEQAEERAFRRLRSEPIAASREFSAASTSRSALRRLRLGLIGVAAALILALVMGSSAMREFLWGIDAYAVVETAEGGMFRASDGQAIRVGERIDAGEAVRTNGGAGTVLRLADGSKIEMRSKSQLLLEHAADGVRIRLVSGSVIVDAEKQRAGRHLYVETKDVMVSVVGTVFLVNTEEEGSRVAVLEGEVRVERDGAEQYLRRGEQVKTSPTMKPLAVKEGIAWSHQAEQRVALMQQSANAAAAPRAVFEVASVRINRSTAAGGGRGRPADGACEGKIQVDPKRVLITGATLNHLVTLGYGLGSSIGDCAEMLRKKRLTGGPDWARTERFDIEANIPDGPSPFVTEQVNRGRVNGGRNAGAFMLTTALTPGPRLLEMIQTLLEDRFKLVLRRQTREFEVQLLTVAQGGARVDAWKEGTQNGWTGWSSGCGTYDGIKNLIAPPKPYGDAYVCGISAVKAPTTRLAKQIATFDDRPILDRTGLTGDYTYEFFFTPQGLSLAFPREIPANRINSPTLSRVLQEELGLELKPSRELLEVQTIEHVEMPSEN